MTKEFFDILDEDGNKTGRTKLRNEVHRDGDWHKAFHIWILNENGDYCYKEGVQPKTVILIF